jgi:hypothetical protein
MVYHAAVLLAARGVRRIDEGGGGEDGHEGQDDPHNTTDARFVPS